MNKFKRIISVILCFCMLFCFTGVANAAAAKLTYTYSGSNATVKSCNTDASGTVKIPSKVTYNSKSYSVKFIGQQAFSGCKSIEKIQIPDGVTAIKSGAFRNCTSLTDVYVPETVVSCAYDAFDGCENVTVHCYKANYQFFSVLGFSSEIKVDVVDAPKEEPKPEEDKTETEDESLDIGGIDIVGIITGILGGSSDSDSETGDFVEIDTATDNFIQFISSYLLKLFDMLKSFIG